MYDMRNSLAQAVREKGIKQSFLSERTGIAPDVLSRILRKERGLKADELMMLSSVLGMTPTELAKRYPAKKGRN